MKKLFLLIPALILSVMMNAETKTIGPDDPTETVNNQLISALGNAADGDIIILKDGIYNEESNYVVFNKDVEVRAAAGANPVVKVVTYLKVEGGKHAIIDGLIFDGSAQGSRDQYFRFTDNGNNILELNNCTFNDVKKNIFRCESGKKFSLLDVKNCTFAGSLSNVMKLESNLCGAAHFDGCEFSNTAEIVIYGTSASHLDECVVNDCYFHDNAKQSIYFEASGTEGTETCDELTVTNSTFANTTALSNWISIIDVRPYGSSMTDAIKVTIDHCTFYNNPTVDSGHADIRLYKLSDATVSNCIFAHPEAYERRATYNYGGSISNCLTYNLTYDASRNAHRQDGGNPVLTNNFTADPLFTDAANANYSFPGNWVTMNLSPARGAATDGSDLGDPRWYSAEVLPSVDFASPYVLDGLHAKLNGNIALDEDNFLKQNNNSDPTQHGTATWKIHATKSCYVSVTPDIKGGSGHHYQIAIYDANNNLICEPLAENDSWASDITPNFGTILIPAGDYKVVLSNLMNNSGATLRKITLAYIGGDVQAMPGTTNIADAWFSSNGTRADGKISYSSISSGCWAKWNINVTAAGTYNVTVNISGQYGHKYVVEFLKEGESTPIVVTKGTTNYDNDPTLYANELGSVILEAANYEMKVFNDVGDAALHSVKLEYAGGGVQNMPGTTELMEAWFSSNGTRNNGAIEYTSVSSGCWAKWNLAFAKGGNFNVIVNIRGQYGHQYVVEFLKEGESTPIVVTKDAINYHNDPTLYANELGMVTLEAGNYEMKVSNNVGDAALISVTLEYLGGAVVNIPNAIPLADALLHDGATRDNEGLHFKNAQYVEWNIHATEGLYTFAATCTSSNYSNLTIKVKQGTSEKYSYTPQYSYTGDKVISSPQWLLDEGDYTLELSNPTSGSGYITTLSATAATDVFILDENTEGDGSIAAAAATEEEYTFLLKRSFTAGKYYTICIPVGSWNDELKLAFGADYELWKMSSAIQSGDEIALNFEQINGESFHAGMPYIIKPSVDVLNPIFYNKKEIKNSTYNNVQPFEAADFIGTFYKDEIPAGVNNLYLQNNNLYYSESNNTPIKGTRAWIRLNQQSSAPVRARIVLGEQVATDINLVNGELVNGTVKTIENGQVIIIRDGIRYNVMGAKIQ